MAPFTTYRKTAYVDYVNGQKALKLRIDAAYHTRNYHKEDVPAVLLLKEKTLTALLKPNKFLGNFDFFRL
jgi:hypothetical protein